MQIHWPLVISTACQRAGLGLFVCAWIASLAGAGLPLGLAALVCLLFLVVGGCASVFHLQRPQRFFNAFSNPKSHLTQEGVITPFLGVALLLVALGVGGGALEAVAFVLALAFLVVTGLAYQMKSRPAWNTPLVLALFLLTALAAGFVGATVVALCSASPAFGVLALCAAVAIAACLAVQAGYVVRMRSVGYGVAYSAFEDPYRTTALAWMVCAAAALALMIVAAVGSAAIAGVVSAIAWICIIASIAAWTVLFFKGAHKVKMFPMYPVDLNVDM